MSELTGMNPHSGIFELYQNNSDLSSRLAAISARKQIKRAAVALRVNGQHLFAAIDRATPLDSGDAAAHRLPAGCLTKPITATLLAQAALRHHIDWSNAITDVLAVLGPWKRRLTGITLRHLLNHTHGLDASAISCAPKTPAGLLDADSLCAQLSADPLSTPGTLYCYSNVGAWFAGALLEQLEGKPYAQLLEAGHLWPSNHERLRLQNICPAAGAELELTLAQWLAFLESHLQAPPQSESDDALAQALASLRAAPVALPGWCPSEQGASLGWKFYGAGWFGHNADLEEASALLRFNPEQGIAIVVEAAGNSAFSVLAGLMGTALPEFANLKAPRFLNSQECSALELDQYVGTYVRAQNRLEIDSTSPGQLRVTVATQESSQDVSQQIFRPAQSDMFIPEQRNNPELSFVQFVQANAAGAFGYVWNGKQLWRRQ
jgi:hypothetical protein